MITGYGVAEAVRHYYQLWGGTVAGKKAVIQGWGNVGAAAAYYLAAQGVHIVGIIDRAGGLLRENGFTLSEIKALYLNRQGNALAAPDLLPFAEVNERIWDLETHIFVPAAASRLVTQHQVERLLARGLQVISCGANVPFQDAEIFFGATAEFADRHVSVIPDFIANCGMARVFAYLMQQNVEITDQAIFTDVSAVIREALATTFRQHPQRTEIAKTAFEIALRQLI
jgi:glutamate dehydrogenase/leucine dehydrogenase